MLLIRQDFRALVPTHSRARIVSALAIVSLALGIAGNAVVFSLVDASLFLRLPYSDPERIVLLGQRERGEPDVAILNLLSALPVWADYKERSRTLTDWATLTMSYRSVSGGDRSVAIMAGAATPSFFRVLGAQTIRGRTFTEAEGVIGGPRLAVVSSDYWRLSMGGSDDVVGTTLLMDGEPYEVIGVLPDDFDFLTPHVDVWTAFQEDPYAWSRHDRGAVSIARMAPGVTMEQVEVELARIALDIEAEFPEGFSGWTMLATNLGTEFPDPQSRRYMRLMQGAVFFVLLITCANVTNLLLVRSQDRTREIAVRTALGASRLHILSQLMRESMVLAASGGLAGLALTWVAVRVIRGGFASVDYVPRLFQPVLDLEVVLFATAVTLFCGIVFGLFPALQSFRVDQVDALKQGGSSGGGRLRARVAAGLVIAQTALSFVALGGGLVLTRGFLDLLGQDPGFDAEKLLTVGLDTPEWKYDAVEGTRLLEGLRDRATELPGVTAAALVRPLPKALAVASDTFRVDGAPLEGGVQAPRAVGVWASPAYLETFGVPRLQGRFFLASDRIDTEPVVVVSRSLAERHFAGRSPLGERVTFLGRSREIVGVVGDVQHGLVPRVTGGAEGAVYVPVAQEPRGAFYLVLRTEGNPRSLAEPIQAEVWAVDPDLTVNTVETMQEYAGRYTVTLDLYNSILGAFSVLALLLASLGTYGVVAYAVGQRTHEIGVRLALGARAHQVVWMIGVEGIVMSLAGLAVGALLLVPVMLLVAPVMEGFSLEPPEPMMLAAVGFVLFAVSLAASIMPATRASTVNPVSVLKTE